MLIPSIDLQGGRIVQLVQGERLAVESTDIEMWIDRFRPYSKVQLIDLDAAKSEGTTMRSSGAICARAALPCWRRHPVRRARAGRSRRRRHARHRQFGAVCERRRSTLSSRRSLAEAVGADRVIAAVDSRGGKVVIHGWRTQLEITPADAVRVLEPLLRRVPLHARGPRGAHGRHRYGRDRGGQGRHVPAAHRGGWDHHARRSRSARRPGDRRRRGDGDLHRANEAAVAHENAGWDEPR